MKPIRRPRICVEQLEQRDNPSLSIVLAGDNLLIYGMPTPNSTLGGTGGLQITATATNTFQVKDHGNNIGHFLADGITLNLVNHIGTSININLGGNTLAGNLTVNLGTGDNSGNTTKGLGITDGTISGNVLVRGGSGNENVLLGLDTTNVQTNLTIAGNFMAIGKPTGNSATAVGNLVDTGVTAKATPPVNVLGNFYTTGYNGIGLTAETFVGGNVILNGGGSPFSSQSQPFAALVGGKVGGNVIITGTPGSVEDNIGTYDPNANGGTGSGATIGGSFVYNGSNGSNVFVLAGTIGQNATITAGNGNNTVFTALGTLPNQNLQVNGNLTVNFGNGNNDFVDDVSLAPGISSAAFVNGNLSVSLGNGVNDVGLIGAEAFGDMRFTLGNGANNPDATLDPNNAVVAGTFYWTSGSGGDTLSIPAPTAGAVQFNVAVQFGAANDTFNLGGTGAGTVTISGRVDGGGRIIVPPGNVFNQDPATSMLAPFFTLSNFP